MATLTVKLIDFPGLTEPLVEMELNRRRNEAARKANRRKLDAKAAKERARYWRNKYEREAQERAEQYVVLAGTVQGKVIRPIQEAR